MIFANIFYFFSAIIIISFSSIKNGIVDFPLNIIWIFVLVFLFIRYNQKTFSRLRVKYDSDEEKSLIKRGFNKTLNANMVFAVLFFSLAVLAFDLKFFLLKIPLLGKIQAIIDISLMAFFLFFLSIVWYWGFKYFGDVYSLGNSAKSYIKSNIKFNLAIIIPWFIVITFETIFSVFKISFLDRINDTIWSYPLKIIPFIIVFFILTPYLITKLWDSEPLDEGELNRSIYQYCLEQNVRFRGVLSWNALNRGLITAAVMGIVYPFRYLLITPKLIGLLDKDEIMAVVSHEVGHVKKKHMFYYLLFFFTVMPILYSFSNFFLTLSQIIEPGRSLFIFFYEPNDVYRTILMVVLILFFFIIYFRFFFGYLMRNFERQADLYCFESGIDPKYLISSFEKLDSVIDEPRGKKNWHHFNISERVNFLKRCVENPPEIKKHNKKVRNSLTLMGLVVFLLLYLSINTTFFNLPISDKEYLSLQIDICKKMIRKNPDNFRLYSLYGTLNYEAEDWEQTIIGYTRSLQINMEQPEVLNNLAWLLLTCKDKKYLNKTDALKYARMAWNYVKENESSGFVFILDTLAEAYYQNGMYDAAFKAAKKAKKLAKDNKEHYDKQYKKMKKAKIKNTKYTDTI